MKKHLFLFAAAMLCCGVSYSAPVDKAVARQVAQSYLAGKGKVVEINSKPVCSPRKRNVSSAEESPYYYIFNAEGGDGYVIVSGDDRTPEILGYVEHGTFDEDAIPESMKSWLTLYTDQMKYLDDNDVSVDSKALKARRVRTATRHSIPVLVSARWNQGHPYNLTCPVYYKSDGTTDKPASGCVATALAQVMYRYKYPAKTKTIIPAHSNTYTLASGAKKTVNMKAIYRNTAIDWENMCDTYSDSNTGAQDSAVANLMLMIGQAVKMGYGSQSGAVFGQNVVTAFTKYFGYDDSAYMAYRDQYTIDEWFDLLYSELAKGKPIAFSGSSSGGAHAFVIDGFDGEQLFHLNWGWGGGSDGWFLIGILNPGDNSGTGASSSSDGYSMGQCALMNLSMPDNVRVEATTCLTINDIEVNGNQIKGNYINWTGSTNTFAAAIVRSNDDGTFSTVGSTQTLSNLGNNNYESRTFTISNKVLKEGTYKLSPASRLSSNRTWRPQLDCKREYIEAVVDAAGKATLRYVKPVEDISIDTVMFMGKRIVGQEQEVKVTFRNHGDEYYREVRFFASTTDTRAYTDNRSIVAIRPGETTDVSFFFTPSEEGTYNLWFCTNSDGTGEVGSTTMDVVAEAQAEKDKLSVVSFNFSNMVSGKVYGTKLVGTCNIRNTSSKAFNGKVLLQLWRQPSGSNVAWTSSSRTVEMAIEPARTSKAAFEFSDLDNTSTYRIQVCYVGQSGELSGGGLWDHGWVLTAGALYWKETGAISAYKGSLVQTLPSSACGAYFSGYKINRFSAYAVKNPNAIFAIDGNSDINTRGLDGRNVVVDGHAQRIDLTDGYAYCCPVTFDADTAYCQVTLPAMADSTPTWHSFTLPFDADSVTLDGVRCVPNDSLSHFWIYEFAYTEDSIPVFAPATSLRANTPYIIAADRWMEGKTVRFEGYGVSFAESGSDKMIISSPTFCMYGSTFKQSLKDVYALADDGLSFVLADSASVTLSPMQPYLTTTLTGASRPQTIALPTPAMAEFDPCDINGDGAVDIADVRTLVDIVLGQDTIGNESMADINGDGYIDGIDIVALVNRVKAAAQTDSTEE